MLFSPILLMLGLFAFFVVMSSFFVVRQQTAVIIERLGRFTGARGAGLHFKIPIIDRVAGRVSLKIQQLDVLVETKTKDNVFVKLKVSVQFRIMEDSIFEALYKLQNPTEQITA